MLGPKKLSMYGLKDFGNIYVLIDKQTTIELQFIWVFSSIKILNPIRLILTLYPRES